MDSTILLHELISASAVRDSHSAALADGNTALRYGELAALVEKFASGMLSLGLKRSERVGIYLEKRFETVIASFGAAAAGGVFVPLNPLLKPEQVGYILRDCNVRVLVTSQERYTLLAATLAQCPDLREVVLVGVDTAPSPFAHFGRADPVAGRLHHLVAPANKIQKSLRVHTHRIT